MYRRGARGHDPALSFPLLPLWQVARNEAMAAEEVEHFGAFVDQFRHRALDLPDRIQMVARAVPWRQREAGGERLSIDLEYLVDRAARAVAPAQ